MKTHLSIIRSLMLSGRKIESYKGFNWYMMALVMTILFANAYFLIGTSLESVAGLIGLMLILPASPLMMIRFRYET